MSLDVYLESKEERRVTCSECWHERAVRDEIFAANITHNLGSMAREAGIYHALWRPEELGITEARQLIGPLSTGLALMKSDPQRFLAFNAPNGWGLYKHFVPFVESYLEACRVNLDALVRVSR